MNIVTISLNDIQKVKTFVNLVNQFDSDFDLESGRYTIDAKSIMGIFSLDLTQPLKLVIHECTPEILEILCPFIIKE